MLKRNIVLTVVFVVLAIQIDAQSFNRWKKNRCELTGGIGITTFLGELGGGNGKGNNFVKDVDFLMTRPVFDLGVRYKLYERFAIKVGFSYAILRGDDKQTKQLHRRNRNLNFFAHIVEMTNQYEYYIVKETSSFRYNFRRMKGERKTHTSVYVFTGVSAFWFNTYGKRQKTGEWVALQPLGTEGQGQIPTREKYNRFQVAIPYGVGIKYGLSRLWLISLEFGARKTFTDYIDDVSTTYYDFSQADPNKVNPVVLEMADPSLNMINGQTSPNQQRGDPQDNDSYSFLIVSLIYKLNTPDGKLPTFKRRHY